MEAMLQLVISLENKKSGFVGLILAKEALTYSYVGAYFFFKSYIFC